MEKKNSLSNFASQYLSKDQLLSGFPKSYVVLVCLLLFNQRGILSGFFYIPWGTIQSISVLAIVILPAFKAFPKRDFYLGLAMFGYGLNSLRILLRISFNVYMIGTIVINVCTALVFFAAGAGLIWEKRRALTNRILVVAEGLFVFFFAMGIVASMGDASDDFQEFGLTFSALFMPALVLISAGLMYKDYTCAQFPMTLVNQRTALIAMLVFLVIGATPLRSLLGRISYSSPSYSSRPSYSYSSSGSSTGAGGYDMPHSGESFSDYVKRVDPGLYSDMESRYNGLE